MSETRASYSTFLRIPTRWHDNDRYGHVNTTVYYAFFDTAVNEYMVREGGFELERADTIAVCAESSCRFLESFSYPEAVDVGVRVEELRTRSVVYAIGVFREGRDEPAAVGRFAHVFVDRETGAPTEIPPELRATLERITRP